MTFLFFDLKVCFLFLLPLGRPFLRKNTNSLFFCGYLIYIIATLVFFFSRENRTSFRENFCSCFREKSKVCVKKILKVHVKTPKCPWKFWKNLLRENQIFIREKKTKIACVEIKKWPWKIWGKSLNVPFFANVFQFSDDIFRTPVFLLLIQNSVRENKNLCVKKLIFVGVKTYS